MGGAGLGRFWVCAHLSAAASLQLRAQVRAGRCLSVDCSLKARQQAKAVLRHFNVRVTHADIFSRCQVGPTRPGPAREPPL